MHDLRRLKAELFQALGHPTRLAILELLQGGELTVTETLARLGMEQANVSQHLAILRGRHLVSTRKDGNRVFYSLRDPALGQVLVQMRHYCAKHLTEELAMLRVMRATPAGPHRAGRRRGTRS